MMRRRTSTYYAMLISKGADKLTYDELQMLYENQIYITETDLGKVPGLKGLYANGCIAIDKSLSEKEKGCILSEEIGHHLTSVGNIIDQRVTNNRKQEYKARAVGYDIKIGLDGLIKSFEAGCKNLYDIANFLDVTEIFLQDAVSYYRGKYGMFTKFNLYIIYFEPCLGVMKFLQKGDPNGKI